MSWHFFSQPLLVAPSQNSEKQGVANLCYTKPSKPQLVIKMTHIDCSIIFLLPKEFFLLSLTLDKTQLNFPLMTHTRNPEFHIEVNNASLITVSQ